MAVGFARVILDNLCYFKGKKRRFSRVLLTIINPLKIRGREKNGFICFSANLEVWWCD